MDPQRSIWILRFAIVGWWIGFSLIAFGVSTIPYLFTDRPLNLRNNFLWHSSWMLWCGLSFVAIALSRKYPLGGSRLRTNLLRHFLLAFAIVLLNVALEFSITIAAGALSGNPHGRPWTFLGSLFGYKFHINLIIYWFIIGVTNAYDNYKRYRQTELVSAQLEAKLSQAELQALKTQLQPHFLFNTHHSIISLMLQSKNEAAIKMLTQLSDLLRVTLQKNQQQFSSLKEEKETLELYLGIQAVRFADRLKIQLSFPPDTLDAKVPYLILQPIVENSIRHGIAPLSQDGRLEIEASIQDAMLHLRVTDNGPGFRQNPDSEEAEGDGVGLPNTKSRLKQLYGSQHILTIDSGSRRGTTVTLTLPLERINSPSEA